VIDQKPPPAQLRTASQLAWSPVVRVGGGGGLSGAVPGVPEPTPISGSRQAPRRARWLWPESVP